MDYTEYMTLLCAVEDVVDKIDDILDEYGKGLRKDRVSVDHLLSAKESLIGFYEKVDGSF